jgi:Ferric reductase NAD binding domain
MQSIYSQLVYEQNEGIRKLDSFKFIWIQRDPVFVTDSDLVRDVTNIKNKSTTTSPFKQPVSDETFDEESSENYSDSDDNSSLQQQNHNYIHGGIGLPSTAAFLSTLPQDSATDDELTQYYDAVSVISESTVTCTLLIFVDDDDIEMIQQKLSETECNTTDEKHTSFFRNGQSDKNSKVFDLQIYITGKESDQHIFDDDNSIQDHVKQNIHYGRPDIYKLFRTMRDDIISRGDKDRDDINNFGLSNNRVAVCVCAPSPVADVCRKASIIYSNEYIRFDVHFESMCV